MPKQHSIPPAQPGPILLVDDEVELVEAVSTMLRAEFGDWRVRATSDVHQALAWIEAEKPGVLVADVRMPGLSGLELLERTQQMWGPTPTIIITAFPTEAVSVGARRGSFLYLPKPFSFRSLLDTVQQLEASPPASFSGAIAVSTLADLLQLYAISGSTGLMLVKSGDRRGEIWFERGQVTHSRTGDIQGFDAFCSILQWPKGSFSWQTRRADTQTIHMSVSELMLEAYRIHDEQAHNLEENPPSTSPSRASPSTPPRQGIPSSRPGPLRELVDSRALDRLQQLDGFIAAALVDSEASTVLAMLGEPSAFNLEVASVGNAEVLRAKRRALKRLELQEDIEDILITLGKQYHLIRPLRSRPGVFFYLAVDRAKASLALARMALARADSPPAA